MRNKSQASVFLFVLISTSLFAFTTVTHANNSLALKLPWEYGRKWYYTGGPHRGWIYDGNAYSALDFASSHRNVVAAADGTVIFSGVWSKELGSVIGIDHGEGWCTWYAHLDNRYVSTKDHVARGQLIGYEGSSGTGASSVHLHFVLTRHGADYPWDGGPEISGWAVHNGDREYNGSMSNGDEERIADVSHRDCGVYTPCNSLISDNDPGYPPTATNTPLPSNHSPHTPSLLSPHDSYVSQDGTAPELCWRDNGDPNGDDTVQFYAEVYDSAANASSEWTSSTCWRPSALNGQYFTYKWRVKARDNHGKESGWSETWRFSINSGTIPSPTPPPTPPQGQWQVRYFNDLNLGGGECYQSAFNGAFVFGDWGDDSPGGSCNAEFSARIWRTVHFDGGHYEFKLFADDNARLIVRGAPGGDVVVNQWEPSTAHVEGRDLPRGDYEVVVEYNDKGGKAVVGAWWQGPGYNAMPNEAPIPGQWFGEYWGNRWGWENPIIKRNEGNQLPFEQEWAYGGPSFGGYGLPTDKFSTKFTRSDYYFECGRYRFEFDADDHAELWVDRDGSSPLLQKDQKILYFSLPAWYFYF